MRIILFVFAISVLMMACGGEEKAPAAMDFDDFAGETGTETDEDSLVDTTQVVFETPLDELSSILQAQYDTAHSEAFHPLDRFGYATRSKLQFKGKEEVPYGKSTMVTPIAELFYYSFKDTTKTQNAFYNYLDVLAAEGEGGPVKLMEDVDVIKMPPMFTVVYDTLIVSAKYKCEHEENDWDAFQDSIIHVYGQDYKYQIDVDCGGPLRWK